MAASPSPTAYDALVIGAGFSGLYALKRLRDDLGMRVRLLEAGDGVGGTWYWNRYPGARCDSESYYYCYSVDDGLLQEWEWSSRYPEQPEILSYLNHVADRWQLRPDIQLESRVASAHFDDDATEWAVTTEAGERLRCTYLVSAVGCLSTSNLPDIPGRDDFEGATYHTGQWPHEGVDFRGLRVGMIGTGSSGIQATPVIAEQAEHFTVFQRTPNFSIPARNAPFEEADRQDIKARYREIWKAAHASAGGFPYPASERSIHDVSREEAYAVFEQLWQEGGFRFLSAGFSDVTTDLDANEIAQDFIRAKIAEIVDDPETARKLQPHGYPLAAKRPPIDTDYFVSFNRPNVRLVDLQEDPILEITKKGVRVESGEVELDALVFATGFDAMTGTLLRIDLRGSGGQRLADHWEAGPATYLGLMINGFPNLFTITGPGSPSVLSNMPVSIEQHVNWIHDCLVHMREHGQRRIEATAEAEASWVAHVNEKAEDSLFYHAKSWYLGANIPGKPRIFMPYAAGLVEYREKCREVVEGGYRGFAFGA